MQAGWTNAPAVADGYLVTQNGYDNQIYCLGKGQTAVTVSYESVIGSTASVLIKGTVTDQSPGQTCLGIPAAGTPAISDASMTAWMEYLYEQQPKPKNATGVPVHITATDPNGNYQDIGIATSDIDGNFALMWTPPVPGMYTLKASFDGSGSYFKSYGTASFAISKATAAPSNVASPQPTAAITSTPITTPSAPSTVPTDSPSTAPQPRGNAPLATYIAIAAAVVIILVAAVAVMLRRRK
jgi:hypothetical protein